MGRFLAGTARVVRKTSMPIIMLSIGALVVGAYGITKLQVNDNPIRWFTKDHPIRVSDTVLNKQFGGTYMAYLTLSGVLPDLALEAYHRGFSTARLPGRMELTEGRPPIVLDGAHTPLAAQRVLEAWKTLFGGDGVLLFG